MRLNFKTHTTDTSGEITVQHGDTPPRAFVILTGDYKDRLAITYDGSTIIIMAKDGSRWQSNTYGSDLYGQKVRALRPSEAVTLFVTE